MDDSQRLREEGFTNEIRNSCVGIVAILDQGRVVFIKRSLNVWDAIRVHWLSRKRRRSIERFSHSYLENVYFQSTEILIRYCMKDELRTLEHDLIVRYQPEHNKPRKRILGDNLDLDTILAMQGALATSRVIIRRRRL
jgi:hypothetical protein